MYHYMLFGDYLLILPHPYMVSACGNPQTYTKLLMLKRAMTTIIETQEKWLLYKKVLNKLTTNSV